MIVTLSKSAWHYRLQHYVFPGMESFSNLCPYFWLTIACCFLAPLVLVKNGYFRLYNLIKPVLVRMVAIASYGFYRALAKVGLGSSSALFFYEDDYAWVYEPAILNMSDRAIYEMWKMAGMYYPSAISMFKEWKALNPNWQEILDIVIPRQMELERIKKDAAKVRENKLVRIAQTTARIGKAFSFVLLGLGLIAFTFLICSFTLSEIMYGVLSFSIFISIFVLLAYILDEFLPSRGIYINTVVSNFLRKIFGSVFKPLNIFFLYGKSVLSKNCPGVVWKD